MDKLTKERAQNIVDSIERIKGDYEAAHCEEIALFQTFIKNVAEGRYESMLEAEDVAKTVLQSREIQFHRLTA